MSGAQAGEAAPLSPSSLETLPYYYVPGRKLWKPPRPAAVAASLRSIPSRWRRSSTSARNQSDHNEEVERASEEVEAGPAQQQVADLHYPGPAAVGYQTPDFEPLSPFAIDESSETSSACE